jgi:hypothetical protein
LKSTKDFADSKALARLPDSAWRRLASHLQVADKAEAAAVLAYCAACGTTALLDKWKVPKGIEVNWYSAITPGIEPHLAKCPCGGAFSAGASPRCPDCREPLSATQASEYIERQPAVFKGLWRWKLLWVHTQGRLRNPTYLSPVRWQWQRTWTDLYCIIIDNRVVHDVWKAAR